MNMLNRALFLDRDGVINIDKGHVHKKEDFDFFENIFNIVRPFQRDGYLIVIITNQAGIAKKYYSADDFFRLNSWMVNEFNKRGINITKVYFCPHHPDYTGVCNCRKPEPGMIYQARDELNIDLSESLLIGDKGTDIMAGKNAGLRTNILINKDPLPGIDYDYYFESLNNFQPHLFTIDAFSKETMQVIP